ncbi:MAG: hypothetical protein IPP51_11220 [Bacteroidetes bacterium]|nr:hypothetical protein [Bacteroidota bacterium]
MNSLKAYTLRPVICVLFISLFMLFSLKGNGQSTDSLSVMAKKRANRAALYSAILPGLGQAYNKKYWKLPILYAGFGTLYYFIHSNNVEYQKYKTALLYRYDSDSLTIDPYEKYTTEDIKIRRDYYRRNRDLSYILTGILYTLNILDAYVDSQLMDFDVSDDLSLHTAPAIFPMADGTTTAGLHLTLTFK